MALVLSFIVKTWLFQAFYIPSGSMENTLRPRRPRHRQQADARPVRPQPRRHRRLQGPRRLARPGPEPSAARHVGEAVQRRAARSSACCPDDSDDHLIKRVIGLPGDHVVCCDTGRPAHGQRRRRSTSRTSSRATPPSGGKELRHHRARGQGLGHGRPPHRLRATPASTTTAPAATGSVPDRADIVGRAVIIVWPLDHVKLAVRARTRRSPRCRPPRRRRRPATTGVHAAPAELSRPSTLASKPSLRVERALQRDGHRLLAGMDEVGRGALAGPVSVGVVVIDETLPVRAGRASRTPSCSRRGPRADGAADPALGPRLRRRPRRRRPRSTRSASWRRCGWPVRARSPPAARRRARPRASSTATTTGSPTAGRAGPVRLRPRGRAGRCRR